MTEPASNPSHVRPLTVRELLEQLAECPPDAAVCVCSDRAHATCDVLTEVNWDEDDGRTVSLSTRHPFNTNDDYPFHEALLDRLERAEAVCEGLHDELQDENAINGDTFVSEAIYESYARWRDLAMPDWEPTEFSEVGDEDPDDMRVEEMVNRRKGGK